MLAAIWAADDRLPTTSHRAPTKDGDRSAEDLRDAIIAHLEREIAQAYLKGDATREEALHDVLLAVVDL